MSVETRRRIATRGYRGSSPNRRVSIATFGYHPLTELSAYWREIVKFDLSILRNLSVALER
jgi:hypothetical protein